MPSIEISRLAARHRPPSPLSPARLSDGHERLRRRLRWWLGDAGRARALLHDLNAGLLARRRLPEEAILDRWLKHVLRRTVRFEAGDEGRTSSGGVAVPERRQVHA